MKKSIFHASILALLLLSACPFTQSEEMVISPVPDASVARAQFTTGISNREPVDQVVRLETPVYSIYYFTDLRNLEGRTVLHRWEYGGRVISEIPFEVKGPRWRVFSKKVLDPAMTGKWTVVVVDQSGWPIHASIFENNALNDQAVIE